MVNSVGNDVFLRAVEGLSVTEATALNFELAFELGKLKPGTRRYTAVARDFHSRLKDGRYDALRTSVLNRPIAGRAML